jgi:16S rRNA (guanine527-N7)-methyltransferase
VSFEAHLTSAAKSSRLFLSPRIVAACIAHFELLVRWNRTHNLTRITDPADAARRHYLDCIAPLSAWEAPASFVDVGSGAGFPGLLAALVWPDAKATLVEPSAKRVSFLRLAADAMGVEVEIGDPGRGRGERVLSRATFPSGEREPLTAYVAPGDASLAVWGHDGDLDTWEKEVSTWGPSWSASSRAYEIAGVEPRSLLVARRVKS